MKTTNGMKKNSRNGLPIIRILMVEDSVNDEELILREIKKVFRYVSTRVETEAAFVLALESESWDIIIADYILPSFSVPKILEIFAERQSYIPVIVISGSVNEMTVIDTMLMGARDFIEKSQIKTRLNFVIKRELRSAGEKQQHRIDKGRACDETIKAWGIALELRDKYTAGHTQRVTDLTLRLARRMNVPRDQLVAIHRGALLHDIGKMGVPDIVLLKRDVLDDDEWTIMKMHPKLAYDMLRPIPFLENAIDIPYCHHERWNGSGYPQGLNGEQIPLSARIFSVVDVYDALVCDRPYREAWERSKAIAYILEERDVLFDPQVVDTFVDMVGRG